MKYKLKRFSKSIIDRFIQSEVQRMSDKSDRIEAMEDPDKNPINKKILQNILKKDRKNNVFISGRVNGTNNPKYRSKDSKSEYSTGKKFVYEPTKEDPTGTTVNKRELSPDEVTYKHITHLQSPTSYTAAAHEVGHGKFQRSRIGGTIHSLQKETKSPMSSGDLGATVGLITGARSEALKRQGKKEGFVSKNAHWMIPVAANAPKLIEEGAASIIGLNELKKAGADSRRMRLSRTALANSFGTYALPVGKEVLKGVAGRSVGKSVGKSYYKVKDKISKKKSKDQDSKE